MARNQIGNDRISGFDPPWRWGSTDSSGTWSRNHISEQRQPATFGSLHALTNLGKQLNLSHSRAGQLLGHFLADIAQSAALAQDLNLFLGLDCAKRGNGVSNVEELQFQTFGAQRFENRDGQMLRFDSHFAGRQFAQSLQESGIQVCNSRERFLNGVAGKVLCRDSREQPIH